MKNIQVIDGAENCTYDIYGVSKEDFDVIFPNGQDIEFAEDLIKRVGYQNSNMLLKRVWTCRQTKAKLNGIHGTLFFELLNKKKFYPTKKENEMIASPAR